MSKGNIELYFKHRYREFNHPIGTLTEYFQFEDIKPVLQDLRQMMPKILNAEEVQVLQEAIGKIR